MTKPRILYDLAMGMQSLGFAGIQNDTRLLFDALSQSPKIELSGWVRPFGQSRYSRKTLSDLIQQAEFFGPFLSNQLDQRDIAAKLLDRFRYHRASRAWQLYMQGLFLDSKLHPAHPMFGDLIWRQIFAPVVDPKRKKELTSRQYYVSKVGIERSSAAAMRLTPHPKVRTKGFDFIVTQDTRLMRVHPETRKVVRYHDGLPVSASDTFGNLVPAKVHVNAIRRASKDTLFVCNSTSARDDLSNISEKAGENAVVIPYFIPRMDKVKPNKDALVAIARNRISHSTLEQRKHKKAVTKWFGKGKDLPPFIMSLATIEPRKNYLRLIEAWQLLRVQGFKDLRLMIVGSPGWAFDPILHGMRPHTERGELLHLEKVAQTELPYLYSAAKVFCFPSMAEGFGLPPTEAMQCGCPVVVSDISAHRFMANDAAAYCEPYSVEDIAETIQCVLTKENLRKELVKKGKKNIGRFSIEELLPVWEEFFIGNRNSESERRS